MEKLRQLINTWMETPGNNAIDPNSELPAFSSPLIGIASGGDELFRFLKTDIGNEFYWTPEEAFSIAFPKEPIKADELSVIAWILPQTENTRKAHRQVDRMPSLEWSKARHYGEKINERLRKYVVEHFLSEDIQACAPTMLPNGPDMYLFVTVSPHPGRNGTPPMPADLEPFGLSDGLITPAGKAVRVGSIVVRKRFTPTERSYQKHNEWCLFHATGKCRACMQRCPAGAITEAGHDKTKCKNYIRNVTAPYVEQKQLGFRVNSCGLCQTKVPCENRNPLAGKRK